ncbi:MAG TPA: hypothetical protein PLD10_04565 [Rhodopila sp.]|nr:hypothetical protein [Rhodopila sp.]
MMADLVDDHGAPSADFRAESVMMTGRLGRKAKPAAQQNGEGENPNGTNPLLGAR